MTCHAQGVAADEAFDDAHAVARSIITLLVDAHVTGRPVPLDQIAWLAEPCDQPLLLIELGAYAAGAVVGMAAAANAEPSVHWQELTAAETARDELS